MHADGNTVLLATTTVESSNDGCCSYGITQNDPSSVLLDACIQTPINFVWDNSSNQSCSADLDATNPEDSNTPYRVSSSVTKLKTDCCSDAIS